MRPFGELLKKSILDMGYTVNQFAKKLDFNRGTLYSVFSGTKNLPEEVFLRALSFLGAGPDKDALTQAYYADIYGRETMEHILFLQRELNRIADRETAPISDTSGEAPPLVSALKTLFAAAGEEELQEIYTNYAFSATAIDDAVYSVMVSYTGPVSLRHYTFTELGGSGTENLQALLGSLRYMDLRQNTYILPVSDPMLLQQFVPFPYFFVSPHHLLMTDRDGRSFFFSDTPLAADTVFQEALHAFLEAKPLATFMSPSFDFRSVIELLDMSLPSQGLHSCIESQMCLVDSLSDLDFLDAIAAPTIPLRAPLIRLVSQHYRELSKRACPTLSSAGGCLRFLETGIAEDLPGRLTVPAPPFFRRLALQRLLQSIENGEDTHAILDDTKLRLPKKFAFILNSNSQAVTITSTDYAWSISVEDPHLRDDFFHFLDYCRRGHLVLSREASSTFLRQLISLCDSTPLSSSSQPDTQDT